MTAAQCDGEFAPAKVNLYLHVLGRRDDGYHELDSLVAFADVGDKVSVASDDSLSLQVDGALADGLDAGDNNLVLAAARKLRQVTGCAAGAALHLAKGLPVAAGLGGGSADAGATLRLLCRFWNVRPDRPALSAIARELGADVPVCFTGRPARMEGIGERLRTLSAFPSVPIVLVNPGVPLSTADVFRATTGRSGTAAWSGEGFASVEALCDALRGCRNDLEPAARSLVPAIADVLDALQGSAGCRLSRMSGSGASCFGLFATEDAARNAARSIGSRQAGWWVSAGMLKGHTE